VGSKDTNFGQTVSPMMSHDEYKKRFRLLPNDIAFLLAISIIFVASLSGGVSLAEWLSNNVNTHRARDDDDDDDDAALT